MQKLVVLAAALVLVLVGCGKEEEPVRQLFFPEVTVLKTDVTAPAWFYPATGEMEYLCPDCPHACIDGEYACQEEVHGKDCLFYKFSSRKGCSLVGDKLYYFLEEDLYVYDTTTGEREQLKDTGTSGMDSYVFKGEYLYRYDRSIASEDGHGYDRIERVHLPDMRVEDISGQGLVWKIVDGVGYYLMADSSPYIVSGLYSQPLYEAGETPPAKELLLHEVELGSSLLMTEEAVYWIGANRLREDPDAIVKNLYRYDLEKRTTVLITEAFEGVKITAAGNYLYTMCPFEDRFMFIRVDTQYLGKRNGGKRILMKPIEGLILDPTDIETVGKYVIVGLETETETGKLVYDTEMYHWQIYMLQEKNG